MFRPDKIATVKRLKREALIAKQLSPVLLQLFAEHSALSQLFLSHVGLSKDGGMCEIYLSTFSTYEAFQEALGTLKLYAPSVRSALAKILQGRYTPQIRFLYDHAVDKERELNVIFSKLDREKDGE